MGLSRDDLVALFDTFGEFGWSELVLTVNGTRVELTNTGQPPASAVPSLPAPGVPAGHAAPAHGVPAGGAAGAGVVTGPERSERDGAPMAGAPEATSSAPPERGSTYREPGSLGAAPPGGAIHPAPAAVPPADTEPALVGPLESLHEVRAPSVGIFYAAPEPGAPPFVEVGHHVTPDDIVCIVEVMKLMNHVKAGVAGVVRAVHATNGEMVEHGQPLFTLERDA